MDIRYATLLAATFDKLRISTKELENACKKWGMKINGAKCNIISPNTSDITIDGVTVETVDKFTLLGSTVLDAPDDVSRRIAQAA